MSTPRNLVLDGSGDVHGETRLFIERKLAGLDEKTLNHLLLAVEEFLQNILMHGFAGHEGARKIVIAVERKHGTIVLTIADNGRTFDPRSFPPPDIAADIDHRRPGGLGIHLARKVTDRITYERTNDMNVLTIEKDTP